MALKIVKKTPGATGKAPTTGSTASSPPTQQTSKPTGHKGPKWLKKGAEAHHLIEEETRKDQAREERRGKMRRFWLPPKKDTTITFCDGNMDDSGMLDAVMFMEHNLQIGNSWKNWFVCIGEDEPCPLCQDGISKSYLAGALTCIEHDEFEYQGKIYRDEKRLFVFKKRTLELLVEYAKAYDGLAGCTFHVKRSSADVASVGDVFVFKHKRTPAQLAELYPNVDWSPANYEHELSYMDGKELREMGYGQPAIGSEPIPEEASSTADEEL